MQTGGNNSEGITDINVTPLVDIALVLVIIFMVTAPMVVQSGIVVNSSTATESHGKATKEESIQLKITEKSFLINNTKVPDEQVPVVLKEKIAKNEKKVVTITCDRNVPHGRLVWALDVSKMMGAKSLAIIREAKK